MAQWIRPHNLSREVPGSNLLATAIMPFGKARGGGGGGCWHLQMNKTNKYDKMFKTVVTLFVCLFVFILMFHPALVSNMILSWAFFFHDASFVNLLLSM